MKTKTYAILIALLFLFIGTGHAATPISTCGTDISLSGDYYLENDIIGCNGGSGYGIKYAIKIQADGVHLNLNGHTISGTGSAYGIYVAGSSNTVIEGPGKIENFNTGIFVGCRYDNGTSTSYSSNNNVIKNVTVTSNLFGISFDWAYGGLYYSDNLIDNNIILSNSQIGIYLSDSTNTTISNNTASGGYYGIVLCYSSGNTVTRNRVTENTYGVLLIVGSSNNEIYENAICNNITYGLDLACDAHNNHVYHNNFIDNAKHAADFDYDRKSNKWEYNYWSAHNCGQCICGNYCSNPYLVACCAQSKDNTPLCNLYPSVPPCEEGAGCIPPPCEMVSWWPGDGNANDIVNAKHGTLQGGASYVPGVVGQAFSFDGATGFFSAPDSTILDFAGDFTIDMWVNPSSKQNAYANILRKEDAFAPSKNGFGIEMDITPDSNKYFAGGKDGISSQCWTTNSFSLTPNTWQHLAVVMSGKTRSVYINGEFVNSCTGSNAPIATNNADLQIGNWTFQTFGNRAWKGLIDEVEIFNRTLTEGEIQDIYNAGSAGKCKQGKIIVEKQTIPDGASGSFTFTGDAAGTISDNGQIMVANLAPGIYTSTEMVPVGWNLTSITCDDAKSSGNLATKTATFRLEAGETVKCTFTNITNTKQGTIVIKKTAMGGNGTFNYTGTGTGIPSSFNITTSGGTGIQTFSNIAPGTYKVTESGLLAGWGFTSLICSDPDGGTTVSGQTAKIDLDAGETVTCTFTNTKKGTIKVKKLTDPSPDPTNTSFTFTGHAAGSIKNGGVITVGNLLPGTYTSTEIVPSGWDLTAITCDDGASANPSSGDVSNKKATFKLDPGETVTCTFNNTKTAAGGCTYTLGYWKNHCGFGPQPDLVTRYLPIWLGTLNNGKTFKVDTAKKAYDILSQKVYGNSSNGITKLYAQLLAAKLNIKNGAEGSAVASTIAAADSFLSSYNYQDWNKLNYSQKSQVLTWHNTLDKYNNGIIGPGHCQE